MPSKPASFIQSVRKTPTRTWISIFKGCLAYMVLLIMVMSTKVRSGFLYPITLTSAPVVVIAGFPGNNIGQTVSATILALTGVGLGAVAFVILAELHSATVAQGIVFVIILYFFSVIKARSLMFFGLALLGILVSFAGLYTSLLLGSFSPKYLEDYLKAYTLAGGIVIAVNVLVFPISSEKELRRTMVTALGHIKTFSHLLAKTYAREINDEERGVRDALAQSIRADFGVLQMKLAASLLEINWSRFNMTDYRSMILGIHKIQQNLIGIHSALINLERHPDPKNNSLFEARFLPSTKEAFTTLRRETGQAIQQICDVLGDGIQVAELPDYEGYRESDPATPDDSSSQDEERTLIPTSPGAHGECVQDPLERGLDQRLDEEVGIVSPKSPKTTTSNLEQGLGNGAGTGNGEPKTPEVPQSSSAVAERLRAAHRSFRSNQQSVISDLILCGEFAAQDDELKVEQLNPSGKDRWTAENERTKKAEVELLNRKKGRLAAKKEPEEKQTVAEELVRLNGNHPPTGGYERLLLTVTSFLFLSGQFTRDLAAMSDLVSQISQRPRKGFHIHLFESEPRIKDGPALIPSYEALALLEGRTPIQPKKKTLASRLVRFEAVMRSDTSLAALKTAAAAITFATLLLASSSRQFFINYGLTGGVLSVVVAMSPSLDEYKSSPEGTVSGNIYGMVMLYIFHDVGGYKWNPYGIVCLMSPFVFIMCYLIYTSPPLFPLGLLAIQSASGVIFTEVIYADVPTFTDSPALRAGKALVSMCIALSIAFAFQYLVNRAPARKLLRQSTADLLSSLLSYQTLHAAYVSSLNSEIETVDDKRPPTELVEQVYKDLGKREGAIQAQLIALHPLIMFADLEPEFTGVFRKDLYRKIIANTQLLLDRMREARVMIAPITDQNDFTSYGGPQLFGKLSPYRRFHNRLAKHRLYVISTAMQSKTPLPSDSLGSRAEPIGLVHHDALVLTSRIAKGPDGRETLNSLAFLKAWSYLLCVSSWRIHIDAIEDAVGDLLGVLEDDELL